MRNLPSWERYSFAGLSKKRVLEEPLRVAILA